MIKKLLTIVAIGGFAIMNAQNAKKVYPMQSASLPAGLSAEKTSAQTCNTLSVINPTTSVTFYGAAPDTSTTGCSPVAGYVSGTNCYGLMEHATFIPSGTYSTIVSPSITAVSVGLYRNPTTLRGTKGTGAVGMKIYNVMSGTTTPGTAVVTTTASLVNVTAAQTGTTNLFFYTFTLTPTALPANGFFTSFVMPTAAGDTAVIFQQTATTSPFASALPNGGAWENYGAWETEFNDWGIKMNDVMLPTVCGSGIVNISKNLGISKNINVMPNPSTGLVNVVVNMGQSENLSLNVTNALGQVIISRNYNGISSDVLSLDLTNQANGVYFVTINNGTDKMVQRLILNK